MINPLIYVLTMVFLHKKLWTITRGYTYIIIYSYIFVCKKKADNIPYIMLYPGHILYLNMFFWVPHFQWPCNRNRFIGASDSINIRSTKYATKLVPPSTLILEISHIFAHRWCTHGTKHPSDSDPIRGCRWCLENWTDLTMVYGRCYQR